MNGQPRTHFSHRIGFLVIVMLICFYWLHSISDAESAVSDEKWSWTTGAIQPDQVNQVDWYAGSDLADVRSQMSGSTEVVTYRMNLGPLDCVSCILTPGLIIQEYAIYVNGLLKASHGSLDQEAVSPRGKSLALIRLPSGEPIEVLFMVKGYKSLSGIYGPIHYGEERDVTGLFLKDSIPYLIATIVVGFSALLNWIIFYPVRMERIYLFFGFACIAGCTYLFCKTPLIQLYASHVIDLESIELISFYLLPLLTWLYFTAIMSQESLLARTVTLMLGAFAFYALLEAWFLHETMRHLLLSGQYVMLFTFLLMCTWSIRNMILKRVGTLGFSLSLFMSIGLVLFGLLVSMFTDQNIDVFPWIGFAFVTAQVYLLANRAQSMNSTLISQTVELQNKNDELIRLSKLKDEFLANTSHELRTPLTGIIGLTEHLLTGAQLPIPDKAKEHLHMIHCSSKRLSVLINDILDFSQIRAKGLAIQSTKINLKDSIQQVLYILTPLLKSKRVKFESNIPDDVPFVLADANRLQQMLHNLVGNAIKFTHEGSIRIHLTWNERFVTIHIYDTGIGMSEEQVRRIFEPFEQAHESIGKMYGGTGLGLAVTRQLAELHGGSIDVRSVLNQGSEFMLHLPIANAQSEEIQHGIQVANKFAQ